MRSDEDDHHALVLEVFHYVNKAKHIERSV